MSESELPKFLMSFYIDEETNALVEKLIEQEMTNRAIVGRQALRFFFLSRGLLQRTSDAEKYSVVEGTAV